MGFLYTKINFVKIIKKVSKHSLFTAYKYTKGDNYEIFIKNKFHIRKWKKM